ncbi:MAG: hypothetical protein KKC55_16810 [Gammaproteobacteria bacterium]|uniref:Putative pectate lyase n=1 Tax=viral metagenome TaxID=1070528 RepID=A0A6M3MGJ1_9ZZZZ|nr:hypothetical protein [Gammaproteobacteria bacterium]
MAYNTGNPVEPDGSDDPRDLIDNAQIADKLVNSDDLTWPGRLGKVLKTQAGFAADFETAQDQRAADYAASEANRGYETPVPYAAGIALTRSTQIVQYNSELYKAKAGTLPWTTTGVWATDSAKLVSVGDNALRQELATGTGASLLGFALTPLATVINQSVLNKAEGVLVEQFGAVGDGVADDTAAFNAAFASGYRRIRTRVGGRYKITEVIMSISGSHLWLAADSEILPQVATAKAIQVAGAACSIQGFGTIRGLPVFDGANVRPTYGLVWVTGDWFKATGITIDTVPKEAIMFEESTYHSITGVTFLGRYPQASYDENTTTNHCAIMYNPPPTSTHPSPFLHFVSNIVEGFIQGILAANYGAAATNEGVLIATNNFKNCWDHGVYMSRGKGQNITGNHFLDCRRPIVTDGIAAVVTGNTLYSDITTASNGEQMISVRESSYSVVAFNTVYGMDAAIYLDNIETTDCIGNLIYGNNIRRIGRNFATSAMRMAGAQVLRDNALFGNTIDCDLVGASNYLIEITVAVGYFGGRNVVADNPLVKRGDLGGGVLVSRCNRTEVKRNGIALGGSAASATTVHGVHSVQSAYTDVDGNSISYLSGGSNVTLSAVTADASSPAARIKRNKIDVQATLAAAVTMSYPAGCDVSDNTLDSSASLTGTAVILAGATSIVVPNANCTANSFIFLQARDVNGAAAVRNSGIWVVAGLQSFTIFASAAVAGNSTFSYRIN